MSDVRYTDPALVSEVKATEAPLNRNHNGYGSKIPTRYMIKYNHYWYRVYMMQYSNSGVAYIVVRRSDLVLDMDTRHKLEDLK